MTAPAHLSASPIKPRLSKSKIAAFESCPRKLWLQVHRPGLVEFDPDTLALFKLGHQVGELARWRHPGGVLVAEDHRNIPGALTTTARLIAAHEHRPIFEAAFERDGVVVRADILKPDAWGGWELIEVKNSLGVKPYQVRDIASQYWVLQGNRVCISSAIIRHVDRRVTATGLTRSSIGFVDVDVTSKAQSLLPSRVVVIAAARDTLAGPEPDVRPGSHCLRPRCEFRGHCGVILPGAKSTASKSSPEIVEASNRPVRAHDALLSFVRGSPQPIRENG